MIKNRKGPRKRTRGRVKQSDLTVRTPGRPWTRNIDYFWGILTPITHLAASSSLNTLRCLEPQVFSISERKNFWVASPISRTFPSLTQSSVRRSHRSLICPGVLTAFSTKERLEQHSRLRFK